MLFGDLTNSLIVYSSGSTVVEAVQAFTAGFDELANAPIDPAQQQSLVNFYNDKLIKPIQQETGEKLSMAAVLPDSNAQKYLQIHYTVPAYGASASPDDAGDGSAWSAANARFNNYFREIATRFEYRDAMLLDTRGNLVYSVNKGPALGTNILTGPFRESNLRGAYEKAMAADSVDFVWITDFQPFQAALGAPVAFLVSPITAAGKTVGVLALPLPISKVNRIMTADKHWKAAGMGETAETYLAGPDKLMRSDSRLFLEDPEKYQREAVAAGTPPDIVEKAIRLHGTTLVQPVETAAARAAQRGQTGTVVDTGYLGVQGTRGLRPAERAEFGSALVDLGDQGQRRSLRPDRVIHPDTGIDHRGVGFRHLRGRDAGRPDIRAAAQATASRRAGDQRGEIRHHGARDHARRDRRPHRRLQRDEPESGDQ